MIVKEKCKFYDDEEGKWYMYHYFDISIENDVITVKVAYCGEEFSEETHHYKAIWHIPVQKVPELLTNITNCFFNYNPYKNNPPDTNLGDSWFVFGPHLNERSEIFDRIVIRQSNDYEEFWNDNTQIFHEHFTMEWNDKYATPMELNGKRIMPKSLVAFLDGLKKTYNTWQKEHPECEKIK